MQMGLEVHIPVLVGRVQIFVTGGQGGPSQIPFLFMDYTMRSVLGRGMTSTELRYFILPVGRYKIRLENSPSGIDEMRSLGVNAAELGPDEFFARDESVASELRATGFSIVAGFVPITFHFPGGLVDSPAELDRVFGRLQDSGAEDAALAMVGQD